LTGTRGSRLTIIGGGVMGLMTAYYAAPLANSVTVLDKSRVGDPGTASFGLTRSVRNDYLDPQYSRLPILGVAGAAVDANVLAAWNVAG
jgi:glycine/D-amino acid oxidase-like deaminating enzyme